MPAVGLGLSIPPSEAKAFDVVALGESSVDLVATVDRLPALDEKISSRSFETYPGGQAATAAVACARQGWRSRYVGSIGADPWGDMVAEALAREGVEHDFVRLQGVSSRMATILVERATGRRAIVEHRNEKQRLQAADVPPALAASGRVLMVDATSLSASIAACRAARAALVPTVLDIDRDEAGTADLLTEIDVMIVTSTFATAFTGASAVGEGLARLSARFSPAIVVATLGEDGSIARWRDEELRTRAPRVQAVDTTGAGDAFRAGFVSGWLRFGANADPRVLLGWANATAALNCEGVGAQTALPHLGQVESVFTRAYGDQSK